MKQTDIIRRITEGKAHPDGFRVPDGYFDGFTERMMARLPQPRRRTPIWRYAAAAALCVALGASVYLYQGHKRQATAELYADDYVREALDYAMLSNSEIEYYLTEAE